MNKAFQIFSISLLLLAATGNACAAPGEREGWRVERRAERQQRIVERQGFQPGREVRIERQGDRLDAGDRGYIDRGLVPGRTGRYTGPIEIAPVPRGPEPYNAAPDGYRRPGRMTLEERRALRRQINEAGRDIYAPYHR